MTAQHTIYHRVYSGIITLLHTVFISALINLTSITLVNADQTQANDWLVTASETIKKQEKILKLAIQGKAKIDNPSDALQKINQIKSQSLECITRTETQILKVSDDLKTLGETSAKEAREVINKRRSLTQQLKKLDTHLSSCKLLQLQSQDLIKSINLLHQDILAQQLSAWTPDIITVLAENIKSPVAGWKDSLEFLKAQYNLKLLSAKQLILFFVLLVIGIFTGIYTGKILRPPLPLIENTEDSISAFILAVRTSVAHTIPLLLPVGITAAFLSTALPLSPLPFITKASYILGIYLCLILIINILLSPTPPALVYLTKPEMLSRRFGRQLKILVTLGLIGSFILTGEFRANLSEPVYYLSRSIFSVLLIINLIAILWLLRLFSWAILSRRPRIFLSLVLVSSLLAELAGYRNLFSFVLGGVLATMVSLGLTILVYRLLKDVCDGLDEGRLEWEKNIRKRLGLKKGAMVPGLIWIRFLILVSLWGGFTLLALKIWQLDDPWRGIITSYLTDGFQIGSLTVTPNLLAKGLLAIIIILSLTRYIKNHILPHGLKYTNLDRGAREAVTSLVGYLGVAIAFLIALSITGVKMQNIAIIAGALSVGIGFGLQNIVNNFISGLILLFERPVRRGDWIVTGEIEGYVKAINIRSTQIQTFDRADVIVPNSELITAKVTNWMLGDSYGRITIPIGVGYNSDVEKVHQILLDIADNHPMTIKEKYQQLKPPKVLFRNFGDNSLNFELRCFIGDIDKRLNVISEINFAIIAAFRREGIEIPFPQRVVTVANWQGQDKDQNKNEPD